MSLQYRIMKRGLDFAAAFLGLLLVSPLLFFIAMWIWLGNGRPIFFKQERVGRRGRPFRIWKFRTMVVDAPQKGGMVTVAGDSRITKIGNFLRNYKLDELPQLFNVLVGEMSLVGPRPEVQKYVNMYSLQQREILAVRPGISSPASLKYRQESELMLRQTDPEEYYVRVIMPDKIAVDLAYLQSQSFINDLVIIAKTLFHK